MALESKDLWILLLCVVTALVSLQYQGELEAIKAFQWPNRDHDREIHLSEWQRLPKPIVTDMDGDGLNEVIVASSEPKVSIYKMTPDYSISRTAVPQPTLFASASLLSNVRVRTGRHPVAMATGYRSPYKKGYNRRQVLVVLTREWTVLCFDYKLNLLWKNNVQQSVKAEFPTNLYIKEVAIIVDAHAIMKGDAGSVVIGGSLSHERETSSYRVESIRAAKGSQTRTEKAKDYHHFSYYAFDCKTGNLRWQHQASSFQPEKPAHEVKGTPSNFKNDESHLLHLGEVDWRVFRSTLLEHLPHSWQRREDTRFTLAHFDRRKRKKTMEGQLQQAIPTAHIPSLTDWTQTHTAQEHVMQPNTLVVHLEHGIEVIHLYTGRTICQLTLSQGVWSDVNGDGVIDHAYAVGSHAHAGTISDLDTSTYPKCYGHVDTGVPKASALFNLSVCHPSHYDLYTSFKNQRHVETVAPVTIPRPGSSNRDVVFFASNGELTSVDSAGRLNWAAETICTWEPLHASEAVEEVIVLSLHEGLSDIVPENSFILAVAPEAFAILEPSSGVVVQEVTVSSNQESPITSPITVGDINGDGVNDLVFTTTDSVAVYALQRRPSSRLFSAILGLLVVLIICTMVTNQVTGSKDSKKQARD